MARVSSKYSNTEIVEYFTILIIEIGFGKNVITGGERKPKKGKYIHTPVWLVCSKLKPDFVDQKKKGKKEKKKSLVGESLCKILVVPFSEWNISFLLYC